MDDIKNEEIKVETTNYDDKFDSLMKELSNLTSKVETLTNENKILKDEFVNFKTEQIVAPKEEIQEIKEIDFSEEFKEIF